MTLNQAEESLRPMEQQSGDLLGHRQRLIQRQKELTAICERVSCYRGLEIPLDGLDQFSFLHFVTGSLPAQNLESLGKEVGDNVALLPLAQQKGQQSLFAITTRQGRPALERALQQAGFQREMLPVVEGATVDRLSEEGEREQEQLAAELEQLNGRLKTIAAEFALPLAEIEEFVDMECRLLDASQKFPRTEAAVLIAGWVPAGDVAALEQRMGEITSGRYAIQTSPSGRFNRGTDPCPAETLAVAASLRDAGFNLWPPELSGTGAYAVCGPELSRDVRHDVRRCGTRSWSSPCVA